MLGGLPAHAHDADVDANTHAPASGASTEGAFSDGPAASPSASEGESEVSIVGSRPSAPSPGATTVTQRQLNAFPRRTAEDALRLVPGMTLVQHGTEGKGYQYFLRGFDAVHGAGFAVSVHGIPINEWSNVHAQGYVDLGFVIPETIAAVQVTKGPFLLEQGAFAMAGAADYRLGIAPEQAGLRLGMTLGTTGRARALVTYAPAQAEGRNFLALEATTDAGFGQNRAAQHGSVLGLTEVARSPRFGSVSLLTAASASRFELPGSLRDEDVEAGVLGFYDTYDTAQKGESERGLLGVLHEWHGGSAKVATTAYGGYRRLELLENYTGFLVDSQAGDRRLQIQRTVQVGMNVEGRWEPTRAFGLTAEVGTQLDVFSQEQVHVGRELEELEQQRDLAGTELAAHLAAGAHIHPGRALVIHAGARVDLAHVDATDGLSDRATASDPLLHFGPRITLSYRPIDSLELGAAYGRGFRPPEAQALVPAAVPPSGGAWAPPGMSSIDSAELGGRWRTSRYLILRLCGFASHMTEEAVYDHIAGQTLALDGTRRLGLELGVSSNPLSFLTIAADLTWVDARFQESGGPVPFAPWLTGGLHAIATHPNGLRGGLRLLGIAARTLPYEAIGSPLGTVDVTAGYATSRFAVDVELENLLDLRVREGESMFASDFPPGETSALPARHFAAAAPRNMRVTLTLLY